MFNYIRCALFFRLMSWYNFIQEDYIMKLKFTDKEKQAIVQKVSYLKSLMIIWNFTTHVALTPRFNTRLLNQKNVNIQQYSEVSTMINRTMEVRKQPFDLNYLMILSFSVL